MTPLQYCEDKAARMGSSLYYSLRMLPMAQREPLTILFAFFREISEIDYECSDIGVATLKIEWWQTEIAQTLVQQQPRHPVSTALLSIAPRYHLLPPAFHDLLEATRLNIGINRYRTFTELETHCKHTSGTLSLMIAQILGYQEETTLKYAELLGIGLHLNHLLCNVYKDLQHGKLSFPETELKQFNVTEKTLFAAELTPEVQALFAYQATRIRAYYHNAFEYLHQKDSYAQRFGLIRAKLAIMHLRELENEGYQLFKHRLTLTPLHKLWSAWLGNWQARWGSEKFRKLLK